jgi:membrane protein DedA with SNARE-associated domain
MNLLLQTIVPYLLLYKYVTIFTIAFGAAFIVPIPSGSILMAASAYANAGYFNIYLVIILSILGNILGDNFGYWVARKYGKEVLSRVGFRRILESDSFKTISDKFNKHPGFIIFISRFEVLSTLSVNLLSGISKTYYKKYILHEVLGSISQVCFYSLVGYFFAENWQSINTTVGRISLVIALALILFIISFSKKTIMRKLN